MQTGDTKILDEIVHFLEGRQLNPDEESYYDLPGISDHTASLYDHCVLAIKNGMRYGSHGLPLIGSGDWNDGMDKVGHAGKGESVWLGFFQYDILMQFSNIARLKNDEAFADECVQAATRLNDNIEKNAWDGEWYRRAWFDDGTPLGSSKNEECQIDSISQSWSVLSNRNNVARSQTAMDAAYKHLVRKDISIIQLLDPPFDKSNLNPGYIKGYVPGVRENGGQYTHAAIWLVMAFTALKNTSRTWELFNMINPIHHGNSPQKIATYKVEPYVVAADVYSVRQHSGRGGWTWYTGSAGWMYRLIIESILGMKIEGNKLSFAPLLPAEWNSFVVDYKYQSTMYHIKIFESENEDTKIVFDGKEQSCTHISLMDDGAEHWVEVKMPMGVVVA
jgi:cellobiose phosphorylase